MTCRGAIDWGYCSKTEDIFCERSPLAALATLVVYCQYQRSVGVVLSDEIKTKNALNKGL